jgi:hypothetical protein
MFAPQITTEEAEIMWQKFTLAGLLFLVLWLPAEAQDRYRYDGPRPADRSGNAGPVRDGRRVWRFFENGGGTFENVRPGYWVAFSNQGTRNYFREMRRTPDYVEIYDDSRDLPVRIYDTALYQDASQVPPDQRSWKLVYTGRWE